MIGQAPQNANRVPIRREIAAFVLRLSGRRSDGLRGRKGMAVRRRASDQKASDDQVTMHKNILPEQRLTGLSDQEFDQNMEDDIDDLYILEANLEKVDAA